MLYSFPVQFSIKIKCSGDLRGVIEGIAPVRANFVFPAGGALKGDTSLDISDLNTEGVSMKLENTQWSQSRKLWSSIHQPQGGIIVGGH